MADSPLDRAYWTVACDENGIPDPKDTPEIRLWSPTSYNPATRGPTGAWIELGSEGKAHPETYIAISPLIEPPPWPPKETNNG